MMHLHRPHPIRAIKTIPTTLLSWLHGLQHFLRVGLTIDDISSLEPRHLIAATIRWVKRGGPIRKVLTALIVFTQSWVLLGALGAPLASASTGSANSATSWMNVEDSHGINLAEYQFSTDHGSLWHPTHIGTATIIDQEFGAWLILCISSIWFISWALSFNWLNLFSGAIHSVADAFTHTLNTPEIFGLVMAIAAVPVAFFFLTGKFGKGIVQIAFMMMVAVLGTSVFADPVGDVMGSNGLLAQGRDIGTAFAAKVTGSDAPGADSTSLNRLIEHQMGDAFVRRPLQQWNFGQVIDTQANQSCVAAWDNGQRSGDEDRIKNGIRDCGDANSKAMKHVADNPNGSQIGTGFFLILFSTIFLAFAVYFSYRIIFTAMHTIYYAVRAIIGLTITGYIHGGQQSLIYSIVDAALSMVAMICYIVFVASYVQIVGKVLSNKGINGMAAIFVGAIVMCIGVALLKKIGKSLTRAGDSVTARITGRFTQPTPISDPIRDIGPGSVPNALHPSQLRDRFDNTQGTRPAAGNGQTPHVGTTDIPQHVLSEQQLAGHQHKPGHHPVHAAMEAAALLVPLEGEAAVAEIAASQRKARQAASAAQAMHRTREAVDTVGAAASTVHRLRGDVSSPQVNTGNPSQSRHSAQQSATSAAPAAMLSGGQQPIDPFGNTLVTSKNDTSPGGYSTTYPTHDLAGHSLEIDDPAGDIPAGDSAEPPVDDWQSTQQLPWMDTPAHSAEIPVPAPASPWQRAGLGRQPVPAAAAPYSPEPSTTSTNDTSPADPITYDTYTAPESQ